MNIILLYQVICIVLTNKIVINSECLRRKITLQTETAIEFPESDKSNQIDCI